MVGRCCTHRGSHLSQRPSLSFRVRVCHPNTRIYVRLLGPCFKTGRMERSSQAPQRASPWSTGVRSTSPQHIPEAVLHTRKTQPIAAAVATLDSSLPQAVSAETITPKGNAHFSHSPANGSQLDLGTHQMQHNESQQAARAV